MTSSISSGTTIDSIIKVNQLPDSAVQRMNKALYGEDDTEETDKIEEDTEGSKEDEASDSDIVKLDYTNSDESYKIGNYIKKYTSAMSDFLTYLSENKVALGESSLKTVLQDKVKVHINKSAYNDVGMGEYYNLKNILKYSQTMSKYNDSNSSNIIKNLTNFSISV